MIHNKNTLLFSILIAILIVQIQAQSYTCGTFDGSGTKYFFNSVQRVIQDDSNSNAIVNWASGVAKLEFQNTGFLLEVLALDSWTQDTTTCPGATIFTAPSVHNKVLALRHNALVIDVNYVNNYSCTSKFVQSFPA